MQTDVTETPQYRLDVEEILCRLQSDWSLLAELCEILLEELPDMLSRLRESVEAGNCEAIYRAAHYLKGSVGVFGQGRHTALVLRLEHAGRQAQVEEAVATFRELEECMKEFARAVRALKEDAHERSDS